MNAVLVSPAFLVTHFQFNGKPNTSVGFGTEFLRRDPLGPVTLGFCESKVRVIMPLVVSYFQTQERQHSMVCV